jgi:hypothetical protein
MCVFNYPVSNKELTMRLINAFMVGLIFLSVVTYSGNCMAGSAKPDVTVVVSGGTEVEVVILGLFMETKEGYTIGQNQNGDWYYVNRYDGTTRVLDPTPVHKRPPAGLKKHLRP